MAVRDSEAGGKTTRGFFQPIKTTLGTFIAILQTRLELVLTELEEERERFKELMLLALISLFCASLGVVLLTLFVVLIFWQEHWLYAVGGLAALYLGIGLAAGLILCKKGSSKPRLLSDTLSELAKDRERLGS